MVDRITQRSEQISTQPFSGRKVPEYESEDIMYRLYVVDKVRKGREAVKQGEVVSIEDLKKEIESW